MTGYGFTYPIQIIPWIFLQAVQASRAAKAAPNPGLRLWRGSGKCQPRTQPEIYRTCVCWCTIWAFLVTSMLALHKESSHWPRGRPKPTSVAFRYSGTAASHCRLARSPNLPPKLEPTSNRAWIAQLRMHQTRKNHLP